MYVFSPRPAWFGCHGDEIAHFTPLLKIGERVDALRLPKPARTNMILAKQASAKSSTMT
jgi:hypothetical protein